MISVPDPVRFCAWNAEITKCPVFAVFGVIDIVLLIVPATVIQALPVHAAPPAGVITAGLKSTFRSYEITPNPVTSPTVIGMAIVPGVEFSTGSDTATSTNAVTDPDELVTGRTSFARTEVCPLENIGSIPLSKPRNSVVDSRKLC